MNVTKVYNKIGPVTKEREVTPAISVVDASISSRFMELSEMWTSNNSEIDAELSKMVRKEDDTQRLTRKNDGQKHKWLNT